MKINGSGIQNLKKYKLFKTAFLYSELRPFTEDLLNSMHAGIGNELKVELILNEKNNQITISLISENISLITFLKTEKETIFQKIAEFLAKKQTGISQNDFNLIFRSK
jgi:hypothetical protein